MPQAMKPPNPNNAVAELIKYVRLAQRGWSVFVVWVGVCLGLAILYNLLSMPLYEASASAAGRATGEWAHQLAQSPSSRNARIDR